MGTDASPTRRRVASHVAAHPGVHFRGLTRALDLAPGQVQHHLRRLVGNDAVVAEEVAGRTHYFPPEYDDWERTALALVRRETAGDVVAALLADAPRRPAALAEEVGIARSTLSWHVDRLVTHGVVDKRRDDRGRVLLAPARPEATVALLREADPTLAERLVDRFARLVDRLLADAGGEG